MSHEKPSIWSDPNVKAALAEGRSPDDIMVLNCRACGELGYYNQGSSFRCRHCKTGFRVVTPDELEGNEEPWRDIIVLEETLTLQDVIDAECEDYPCK